MILPKPLGGVLGLVLEGIGVRDAVRRSAHLFKQTWGEQMIANAGISLLGFSGGFAAFSTY